jgi:tetratricopeptide (TPR) repeat protein
MRRYLRPKNWLKWSNQFVMEWMSSIRWGNVLKALPVLFLFFTLLGATIFSYYGGESWRDKLLERQYYTAWESQDYTSTELILKRTLDSRKSDPVILYRLAILRDVQGTKDEASDLMKDVIRLGERALKAPAARWIVKERYLGKKWSELDSESQKEFGKLLETILEGDSKDTQTRQLYAEYLIASRRLKEALDELTTLSRDQPMQGIRAAMIARQMNLSGRASQLATDALLTLSDLLKKEPANTGYSLAVAQCEMFLERYEKALLTIEKALLLEKTQEKIQLLVVARGDVFVAWVSHLQGRGVNTPDQKLRTLQVLQSALQKAPNHPGVITLVMDRVLASMESDSGEILALRDALVKGTSPGIAHFIEGTTALMKGETEKGIMRLKLAAELMPQSSLILNNLAYGLATREDPDLDQALEIIQTAIDLTTSPPPHFYETRGQILVKMDRHVEAIPDLQRSLVITSLASSTHELLAICYEAIGEKELADTHRAEASK